MFFVSCARVQIPVPWHHKGGPLGRKFRRSWGLERRPIANVGPPQAGFAATGFGAAAEFIAGFLHRFGEPETLLNLWDSSVGAIPVAPTLASHIGSTDSDLVVVHIGEQLNSGPAPRCCFASKPCRPPFKEEPNQACLENSSPVCGKVSALCP